MIYFIFVWVRKGYFIFCRVKSECMLYVYLNVLFYVIIGEFYFFLCFCKNRKCNLFYF